MKSGKIGGNAFINFEDQDFHFFFEAQLNDDEDGKSKDRYKNI